MRPLWVWLVLLVGCKDRAPPAAGVVTTCTCTYLTDFDDTARVDVEVCVAPGKSQDDEARRCAMQSAHNHIEQCTCTAGQVVCAVGTRDACKNR